MFFDIDFRQELNEKINNEVDWSMRKAISFLDPPSEELFILFLGLSMRSSPLTADPRPSRRTRKFWRNVPIGLIWKQPSGPPSLMRCGINRIIVLVLLKGRDYVGNRTIQNPSPSPNNWRDRKLHCIHLGIADILPTSFFFL